MHSDEEASALIEQIKLHLNFRLHYLNKDIESKESEEIYPLSTAVTSGFCELVCALVDLGVHPDEPISDTHTLLSLATLHWSITDIIKILEHPQYQPTYNINRAILYAVANNRTEIAEALITCAQKNGLFKKFPALLNALWVTKTGNTVLHEAVKHGNPKLIRLLAENGADLYKKNHDGLSPLEMADAINNPAVSKELASSGYLCQYRYRKWYLKVAFNILKTYLKDINVDEEIIDTVFDCLAKYIDEDSTFVAEELSTAIYFLEHLERSLAEIKNEFKIIFRRDNYASDLEKIAQYVIPCFLVVHKISAKRAVWNIDFLTDYTKRQLPMITLRKLNLWEIEHLQRLDHELDSQKIADIEKLLIKSLTTYQAKIGLINDEAALHRFNPNNLLSPLAISFKKELLDENTREGLDACDAHIKEALLEWLTISGIKKYLSLEQDLQNKFNQIGNTNKFQILEQCSKHSIQNYFSLEKKLQEKFNQIKCQKKFLLLERCNSNSIRAFINLEETLFTPFDEHIKILRFFSLEATYYKKNDHSHIEEITREFRTLVNSLREITIDLLCSENSTQLVAQRKICHDAFGAQMTAYLDIKFNNNNVYQELGEITKMTDTIWKAIFDMADESSKQKQEETKENSAPSQHSLFHPKTSLKAAQQKSCAPLGSKSNPRTMTAVRVEGSSPQL